MRGQRTTILAPPDVASPISQRPPVAPTIASAMARPKPNPSCEAPSLWKRAKMFAR